MRKNFWTVIVSLFTLLVNPYTTGSSALAAGKQSWDPTHTWVFIVGVLSWPSAADLDSFDTANRRDEALRKFFLKAGVPADHVVALTDKQATLSNINSNLSSLLAKTAPGDFLFTFYCGHGWLDDNGAGYLGNYDCDYYPQHNWSVSSFTKQIAKGFKGNCALLSADCCYSGRIGEKMKSLKVPFKFATLTSIVGSESSTGNWTFSQALIDCLQGHGFADFNHDGVITFNEMAQYVGDEMKAMESQDASSKTSSDFDPSFVVADVKFPDDTQLERVEVLYSDGMWWKAKVVKRDGNKVKIHWTQIGFDTADSDQWYDASKVRPLKSAKTQGGTLASATSAGASTAKPKPTVVQKYEVGAKVIVKWEGDDYEAVIKDFKDGKYFIHYKGYDHSDDEWVAPSAVKGG